MRISLPDHALRAIALLEEQGFEAYAVGGSVRDALLGLPQGDVDLCTDAEPSQMQAVFKDFTTIPTGLKHGTLTVLMDRQPIEITTYRTDGTYSDQRHPDRVTFVRSLKEDLARRDFTCNAMAWHPKKGLVDFFDGREAIQKKELRAVGQPEKRFTEDALRVLRGLRFACQLGFSIEEKTLKAMMDKGDGLQAVSKERVAQELNRALCSDHVEDALRKYPRLLYFVLEELSPMLHTPQRTKFHAYDVWEHTIRTVGIAGKDLALRWAALYHDAGKPYNTQIDPDGTTHFRGHQATSARLMDQAMVRLKQPKALKEQTVALVKHHDDRVGPDNLKLWISRLGMDTAKKLLQLQIADLSTHSILGQQRVPQLQALLLETKGYEKDGKTFDVSSLAISGRDLLDLGFAPDKRLGRVLEALLKEVLTGQTDNSREALLDKAKHLYSAH